MKKQFTLTKTIKKVTKFVAFSLNAKLSTKNQIKLHRFITSEHIKNNKKNKLFNTIYFELRTRCNGSCSFCAASIQNDTREDITMNFELFKKAINELSQINFEGTIAFHNNSEPLLVKDLDKFIQYTREKLNKVWIQILSNGKSLNIINVKGKNFNILKLWKNINNTLRNKHKKITKNNDCYNFIETLEWYKNNLWMIKKIAKKYHKTI